MTDKNYEIKISDIYESLDDTDLPEEVKEFLKEQIKNDKDNEEPNFGVFDKEGNEVNLEDLPEDISESISSLISKIQNGEELEIDTEKDSEKNKKELPKRTNLLLFEESINEDGELKQKIKDIIKYAEDNSDMLLSNNGTLTVVDSDYDLKQYRQDDEDYQNAIDENMFRCATNIIIEDFSYNLYNMGYENMPNSYLSLEVIENEFDISPITLTRKVADILNVSLQTNIFIPVVDELTDKCYIKCDVGEENRKLYKEFSFIKEIVDSSLEVIGNFVRYEGVKA